MSILDWIVAILAAAGAVLGGWATVKKAHVESRASEGSRLDKHMDRQDDRIKSLEKRAARSERREKIRDDYIAQLRQHIANGHPPPPPPWPESLLLADDDAD